MENEERIYIKENLDLRDKIKTLGKDIDFLNKDNQRLFKRVRELEGLGKNEMIMAKPKTILLTWSKYQEMIFEKKIYLSKIKELETKLEEAKELLYMVSHGRVESKKINHFLFQFLSQPKPAESELVAEAHRLVDYPTLKLNSEGERK